MISCLTGEHPLSGKPDIRNVGNNTRNSFQVIIDQCLDMPPNALGCLVITGLKAT